ncbi:magnesium transporter CorA family protein [Acetobacterium carbinolicum]|jgi:magnesium transporter|uniref:magnesium transporter CorA family protein n=1 Tax=Acetobacterium TaxID=33951 RepID=UPI000DBEB7AB|nr:MULTISPECIES: magnesium transporter CorA family protein [unclassified Acetobacterium]AWW27028.1 magnesium transporter CorA family protein [Acetobacterium sp. KB-1]MDK2942263.1 magnesium transporter [Acetobacterium sp.]MDZ5726639.1 magnesium transporter CorA family protein [Acetobacterium sp. K1/6]
MIKIYKTIEGKIQEVESIEKNSWINMVNPTEEELHFITRELEVESDFLRAALDEEEISRVELEDNNQALITIDVPVIEKDTKMVLYTTIPVGIIQTEENIITVCLRENTLIDDFAKGRVKNVHTNLRTRFIFQILYRVASRFLIYLRHINRMSTDIERQLHISLKNKELIQLLDLEKSLVFFSTSLKANQGVLEKLQRGRIIKLYEEDKELLEDVLIEVQQAIEMSNIYANILSGTMDAFASIISNNLNIVMKILTSLTILMAIPTMIASFYGMNVEGLPVPNFWTIILISVACTGVAAFVLFKKKMFS